MIFPISRREVFKDSPALWSETRPSFAMERSGVRCQSRRVPWPGCIVGYLSVTGLSVCEVGVEPLKASDWLAIASTGVALVERAISVSALASSMMVGSTVGMSDPFPDVTSL